MASSSTLLTSSFFLLLVHEAIATPQRDRLLYPTKVGLGTVSTQELHDSREADGQCPSSDLKCKLNQRCCETGCCPTSYPNCWEKLIEICVNDQGKAICITEDGSSGPGILCSNLSCCVDETFNRCAGGYCVDKDGFLPCGDALQPGVGCSYRGLDYCCPNPKRCCMTTVDGCCDEGLGGPKEVESLIVGSPGAPPKGSTARPTPSSESSANNAPSPSSDPDMSGTETTPAPSANESTITSGSSGEADEDDGSTCFPALATVELEDGSIRTMEELHTGDKVKVSGSGFSKVFMWTHHDAGYSGSNYFRVKMSGGYSLTTTTGHMVYVCKSLHSCSERQAVPIETVQRGQGMWVVENGSEHVAMVSHVQRVRSKGLYNPHTLHGDIVVDGVLSTCYTKYVPLRMAHGAMSPLRALYKQGLLDFRRKISVF